MKDNCRYCKIIAYSYLCDKCDNLFDKDLIKHCEGCCNFFNKPKMYECEECERFFCDNCVVTCPDCKKKNVCGGCIITWGVCLNCADIMLSKKK